MAHKPITVKPNLDITLHRDGSVSYFDVFQQQWARYSAAGLMQSRIILSFSRQERYKIRDHAAKHGRRNPSAYQAAIDADAFHQWQLDEHSDHDDWGIQVASEAQTKRIVKTVPTRALLRIQDQLRRTRGGDPRDFRPRNRSTSIHEQRLINSLFEYDGNKIIAAELRRRRR